MIRRRDFITLLGGGGFVFLFAGHAQPTSKLSSTGKRS